MSVKSVDNVYFIKVNVMSAISVPFLTTKHFDFTGFNNILAYDSALLEAMRIHLTCMLVSVVTVNVMSSINPLLDGRQISVFALVPLDPLFAALIIMFKP